MNLFYQVSFLVPTIRHVLYQILSFVSSEMFGGAISSRRDGRSYYESDEQKEHADDDGGEGDFRPLEVSCVLGVLLFELVVIVVKVRVGRAEAKLYENERDERYQKEWACN